MGQQLRFKLRQSAMIGACALIAGLFQNCSKTSFTTGTNGSNVAAGGTDPTGTANQPNTNPNSCYTVLHETSTDVKLLFVVDQSGSNAGTNGTDPQKAVRGGSIQAFFDDYKTKQNFYWGFLTFAGTGAIPLIYGASPSTPIFTNSLTVMQGAINTFYSTPDGGNTPYLAALDLAKSTIQNDASVTATTKWIVVFLSDGMPVPSVDDLTLKNEVLSLIGIHPGQITFNTIYYGPTDPDASTRLSTMAQEGGGYFLDTNANPTGKDFLISNVVTVPGSSCTP